MKNSPYLDRPPVPAPAPTQCTVWKLLPDGGFVAGDTQSRLTSYAYPTSVSAIAAKRDPNKIAHEMMRAENILLKLRSTFPRPDYDARNWQLLGA